MACLGILFLLVGLVFLCAEMSSTPAEKAAGVITVSEAMPLAEAFEKGMLAGEVQMAPDGKSVILYDLTLVEDDGPGACATLEYGPAAPTTIRGDAQVRKVLRLDRAGVLGCKSWIEAQYA
jgi:hypothetical protein